MFGDDQGLELNVQDHHTTDTRCTNVSGSRTTLSFEQELKT